MDLEVSYSKVTNKDEAYEVVKKAITAETIERFKVSADVSHDDKNKVITAKGKGFGVTISFTETAAQAKVELGFLLKAFKGQVVEGLEKQLKRVI